MPAGTPKPRVNSAQDTHCIIYSLKNTVQNWNNENLASGFPDTDFYYLVKFGLADLCQFCGLCRYPVSEHVHSSDFLSVAPKVCSWGDDHQGWCWPVVGPSMQNQKLLVRPGTHAVTSNPYCTLTHPRRILNSVFSSTTVSPHKPEPFLLWPIPYFHHTPTEVRVTATVATSSCRRSFPASPTLLLSAWALPDTPEASPGGWAMWDGALTAECIPATTAS